MNSYTTNNGSSSSDQQVSGWDIFNSFYNGGSTPTNAPGNNVNPQYEHPYMAAQRNNYFQMGFGRPGYSLGMPSVGYYDQGYDVNGMLGGHSSAERLGYANGGNVAGNLNRQGSGDHVNQEWNSNSHIDEINAGIARHHRGGDAEGTAQAQAPALSVMGEQAGGGSYEGASYGGYPDYGSVMAAQQQQVAASNAWGMGGVPRGNEASLRELDYCDLLLRGLDGASAAAPSVPNNHQQILQNQLMWNIGGNPSMWPAAAAVGMRGTKSPGPNGSNSANKPAMNGLDYFMNSMQQQQPYAAAKDPADLNLKPSHTSPTPTHHKQIDPLLDTLSLTIPSVSLSSLTGNEVIKHIRSKTDDVITRFLPCVDFLVNCQQELRQGLAIANQRKYINGRSRTASMTPHQFFVRFVAPLPKKFEKKNNCLMAREHLLAAKQQLDTLVEEAQGAMPQGCEHIKNIFLGGMRENESWGLRKWMSKHGAAGSICNDLEEVLRTVKALNKEEKTTIKLAEMLRPIAGQAHDRLKKDVPQAYQEQSSAHPYLPFFHRLEACLKQMANYDPEEDNVILLDSDSEDEEDIKVEKVCSLGKTDMTKSSPVKKRIAKRSREGEEDGPESAAALHPYKRGKSLENIASPRAERREASKEVICLDDSSDEEDNGSENDQDDNDDEKCSQILKLEGGLDSPSQSPCPQYNTMPKEGWRCQHGTYFNASGSNACAMCNDESTTGGDDAEDLADFLGGGFMDDSAHTHNPDG